jgi:hypothetical protein
LNIVVFKKERLSRESRTAFFL